MCKLRSLHSTVCLCDGVDCNCRFAPFVGNLAGVRTRIVPEKQQLMFQYQVQSESNSMNLVTLREGGRRWGEALWKRFQSSFGIASKGKKDLIPVLETRCLKSTTHGEQPRALLRLINFSSGGLPHTHRHLVGEVSS